MILDQAIQNYFLGGYQIQIPALSFPFTPPEVSNNQKFISLPISDGVKIFSKRSEKTILTTESGERILLDNGSRASHKWYDPFVIMERISRQRGWKFRPEIRISFGFDNKDNMSLEYSLTLGAIYSYSLINDVILSFSELEQIAYEIMDELKHEFNSFKVKSLLYGKYSEIMTGNDDAVKGEVLNFENFRLYYFTDSSLTSNSAYMEYYRKIKTIKSKINSSSNLKFPYNGYRAFYNDESILYRKIVSAAQAGDMVALGNSIGECAMEIRDYLRITSDFQNNVSKMMDDRDIGNYYFTVGGGSGGIIGLWNYDFYEKFSKYIIKDYFLSYGTPIVMKEVEPGKGIIIMKIPPI